MHLVTKYFFGKAVMAESTRAGTGGFLMLDLLKMEKSDA